MPDALLTHVRHPPSYESRDSSPNEDTEKRLNMNFQQSRSNSYLVRVWRETGEDADIRLYLRDLETGEERYIGDAERLGEILASASRENEDERAKRGDAAQAG